MPNTIPKLNNSAKKLNLISAFLSLIVFIGCVIYLINEWLVVMNQKQDIPNSLLKFIIRRWDRITATVIGIFGFLASQYFILEAKRVEKLEQRKNDPLFQEIKQHLSDQQLGRLVYLINARQRDQALQFYQEITGKDGASTEEDIDILTDYYSVNLSSNSLLPLYVIGALIVIVIIIKIFFT